MGIYLKLENEPKDLNELFENLFKYDKTEVKTAVKTYEDKECTINQCDAGRYRSFDDLYDIATTYFPETTVKECLEVLFNLHVIYGSKKLRPYISYCSDICKITFFYYLETRKNYSLFINNKGISEWSWKELLKTHFNIESEKEFDDYVNQNKLVES